MNNALESLKSHSVVVADTANPDAISIYKPTDVTTNPSLILQQAKLPYANSLIEATKQKLRKGKYLDPKEACLYLAIKFGVTISNLIPGYISTEVDARLSFNTEASVAEALKIISIYESFEIEKSRVLIKLASTWEGIEAAKILEAKGIGCNLTLLFSEVQARAAGHSNVTLISPFVGRIYDWHVARGETPIGPDSDPGVLSVQSIHRLYKSHGISTIVMGASFRNAEQVLALAGCDRLTIAPTLLEELKNRNDIVTPIKTPSVTNLSLSPINRDQFQLALASNPMANEKLAEGITRFIADQESLEALISQ